MNDHIIKAAQEAGWHEYVLVNLIDTRDMKRLSAFYAIAYQQGMERAAEIPMQIDMEIHGVLPIRAALIAKHIQDAIRAHAQNQPESIHDDANKEGA